jgi:peptide deformylase
MRLKILQAGEAVLRQPARPLAAGEFAAPETRQLIEWMRETMHDAPGAGLAAPQIGVPIQLIVIEDRLENMKGIAPERLAERERRPAPFLALGNPRIIEQSEEQAEFFEGCLSVTGFSALVKRSRGVVIEHQDESGQWRRLEATGWFARILQHEIDHLQGRLYIDRMEPRSFTSIDNLNRYWNDLPAEAVRDALGLSRSQT